jgi:uncharacterized membrane protein YdjX (TVP38/TMEM64 family)
MFLSAVSLMLTVMPVLIPIVMTGEDGSLLELFQSYLLSLLGWIESLGAIAPVAFIALYGVVTIAFVPASVVTLGAGVVFGVVKGTALVFVGAMLGATGAFLIGRYLARGWVVERIARQPKFLAIDHAIGREGRKIVFLLRLSPIFPFNLLNYALGLTQVSLKDYVLGTVGILPGTLLYVYLGALVGNLAMIGTGEGTSDPQTMNLQWAFRLIGLFATVAISVYITLLARKALKEAIPEPSQESP